jgi:hypothetical protein
MKAPHKLVYLVTEVWYFLSHRLPMARAARRAGYQVHVLTNVADHGAAIEAQGFHLHPLSWRRGSMNPLDLLAIVRQVIDAADVAAAAERYLVAERSVTGFLRSAARAEPAASVDPS